MVFFDPTANEYDFASNPSCSKTEDELNDLVQELRMAQKRIGEICSNRDVLKQWRIHTKRSHHLGNASNLLKYNHGFSSATQAYCKFMEILSRFPSIFDSLDHSFSTFHLCEGPGFFLSAIDHLLSTFHPDVEWNWLANTLNPYYEGIKPDDKLMDDSHMVLQLDNWYFGKDNSGDIFNLEAPKRKFDLVTADGSIYTQNDPENQEKLSFPLIAREFDLTRQCLKPGGNYVFKCYTLLDEATKKFIKKLSKCFDKIHMFKPLCSKPGNSERYVICFNFGDYAQWIDYQCLIDCEHHFISLQLTAIENNLESFQTGRIVRRRKFMEEVFLETIQAKYLVHNRSHLLVNEDPEKTPWNALYGHNLVDRLKNSAGERKLLRLTNKERSSFKFSFDMDPEKLEKSLTFSTRKPDLMCSMFLDPEDFKSLHSQKKLLDFDGVEIRLNGVKMDQKCMTERLNAILSVYEQNEELRVEWTGKAMFLSRRSASFIGFLAVLYETKLDGCQIQCTQPKKIALEKWRKVVESVSKGESQHLHLLSYIPLSLMASMHRSIVDYNYQIASSE